MQNPTTVNNEQTQVTHKPLRFKPNLRKWAPFSFLVLMLLIVGVVSPQFYQSGNPVTVLELAAVLLMAGLGQTWVVSLGSIDLSVGNMISLSSVAFALLVPHGGVVALVLVIILGAIGGIVSGLVFTLLRIPSFITTLGTGGIYLSLAYVVSGGQSVSIDDSSSPFLQWLEGSIAGIPTVLIIVGVLWVIAYVVQRYTRTGRSLYYIGASEPTAWMSGIVPYRYKLFALVVSGITSSFAGILLALTILNGDPNVGNDFLLDSIAAVVVGGTALTGGVGGVVQTLIGALVMAILSNGMNTVGVSAYFQDVVTGVVIIVAAMLSLDRSKISILK